MGNHHGKTFTQVHGVSKKQQREHAHTHKLQQQQYKHFGKVNWDFFSHRQMWDMVQSAKPQQMYDKADGWGTLAADIQRTTGNVQNVMQTLMTTWRGSAALTASESNSRLTQWGGDAGNTAVSIGTGLQHYADAVTHAQATMPEPVDYVAEHRLAEGYAVNVTDPELHSYLLKHLADDHMATQEQAKTAKAKAIQVMSGYEDRSHDVHEKLPEFQQAPSMAPKGGTATVPSIAAPGGGSQSQPPVVSYPGSGANTPATPPYPGSSSTNPGYTSPSFAEPPTVGGGSGYPNSGYPGGTGYPGGVNTGLPGGGTGSNYQGQGFGGPGGIGGPGAAGFGGRPGMGIGGAGAAGEGAAGSRSGAGALGGAAAAEEAAATRGAAGAAGRGGAGGMYPPMGGSGANGEGDGEHHNKYDNGLDLFDDIPPAYPSVFGE